MISWLSRLRSERRQERGERPWMAQGARSAGGRSGAAGPEEGLDGLDQALQDWHAAEAHFHNVSGVTDPELVDQAIYNLEAAQRKYRYLLRQVQRARGPAHPGGD